MDASEGSPKVSSHRPSGGMPLLYTTRFAGLEIGRTKLAALAMKAQIIRYGSGSAFAVRTAASTAGVSTTAVASLERKYCDDNAHGIDENEQSGARGAPVPT